MNILIEIFSFEFLRRAFLVGALVAAVCSALGVFVVVKKQSLVSHAIADVSFLAVGLGLLIGLDIDISILIMCVLAGFLITFLKRFRGVSYDSVLGIIGSASMALAVFVVSLLEGYRVDLLQYLFGDILAISNQDVLVTGVVSILVLIVLMFNYRKFLEITFNEELALSNGVKLWFYEGLLITVLALTIGVAIKVLGVILIGAFLILPANISKFFCRNFKSMFFGSVLVGVLGVFIGLYLSYFLDVPSGSGIVLVLVAMLLVGGFWGSLKRG